MKYFTLILLILLIPSSFAQMNLQGEELTEAEKSALFDIFIDIPDKYHEIYAGEEMISTIRLVNFGEAGRIDVFLEYDLRNSAGESILQKKETIAIETQANIVRSFDIPKQTPSGTYTIYGTLTYADGKSAIAQDSFKVKKPQTKLNYTLLIIIISIIILIFIVSRSKTLFDKLIIKFRIKEIIKHKSDNLK